MIEAERLSFRYPKAKSDTLHSLDFHIAPGEIFGFLGPSGAGKSTTQAILTRQIHAPFQGNVALLKRDLNEWGRELFNKIGVSFELPNHYLKLTARENLDLFSSLYDHPAYPAPKLLEMVGLKEDQNRRVEEFSKGMKMRLNFVRSFLHDPDLLFFDEPTSGLDPANARNIKDIILDFKARGKTIFLTTHNMNDADELCDRVAFLVDGKIKLIDSPGELKLRFGKKSLKVEYLQKNKIKEKSFDMKGLGENRKFLEILQKHEVRSIHTQEATLDEIFIETTGRRLQ